MSLYQNSFGVNSSWDEKNFINTESIDASANQSVRLYSSNQEYLYAMQEDLAIWLKGLYDIDINVANFFEILGTGTILCQHANNITNCAVYMQKKNGNVQWKYASNIPSKYLTFHHITDTGASSFFARDNIANFIDWCRRELGVHENLMFETNDLVLKKSEKNFILCLLEVARRGSKVGVPAPVLIQMEEDIDEEIEMEKVSKEKNTPIPKKSVKQKVDCDFKSLDEMVQYILGMCTCPTRFRMVKVSDGKYKVGDSENLIFMRILRQHVMVRVGGGWDTLEQYLNKHDPCRCQMHKNDRKLTPRHSRSANVSRNTVSRERSPAVNRVVNVVSTGSSDGAGRRSQTPDRPKRSLNHSLETSPPRQPDKRTSRSTVARTSYTPTPDSRQFSGKHSTLTEGRGRTSTNKSDKQGNVFSRLSRPKSTPPVARNTITFQDDLVEVKRSEEGTHELRRASTKNAPSRHSTVDKVKARPKENNDLRSKSMIASRDRRHQTSANALSHDFQSYSSRVPAANKASKALRGTGYDKGKNLSSISMSPRKSKSSNRPFNEEIDAARERELLAAIEREYIENQQKLQMRENRTRAPSYDDLLESRSTCSYSNAEDNEVAFHMQADCDKDLSHPPSSYHSLPRPRRDKSNQHERRTRIPTPVSFNNRPLLHSRNHDSNNSFPSNKLAARNTAENEKLASDHVVDGAVQNKENLLDYLYDLNRSRDRGNRSFDSYDSVHVKDEIDFTLKHSPRGSKQLDAASLHSSAHPDNMDRDPRGQSTFIPVENDSSIGSVMQPQHHLLQPESFSHESPTHRSRYASFPSNERTVAGHRAGRLSSVPNRLQSSYSLTSTPEFSHSALPAPSRVNVIAGSREAQWV